MTKKYKEQLIKEYKRRISVDRRLYCYEVELLPEIDRDNYFNSLSKEELINLCKEYNKAISDIKEITNTKESFEIFIGESYSNILKFKK